MPARLSARPAAFAAPLVAAATAALAACRDAPLAPAAPPGVPADVAPAPRAGLIEIGPKPLLFTRVVNYKTVIHKAFPDGSGFAALGPGDSPAWSADYKKIVFTRIVVGHEQLFTMNADGTGVKQITTLPAEHSHPKWSPGGGRIAFDGDVKSPGNRDVYVVKADGTGLVRLTANPAADVMPTWFPDGNSLAFASDRVAPRQIFRVDVAGATHLVTQLTFEPHGGTWPVYSPEGTKLLYTAAKGVGLVGCGLIVAAASGDNPKPVTVGLSHCVQGSFAKNGQQLLFNQWDDSRYRLYTADLTGFNVKPVFWNGTDSDMTPSWSSQ